MTKELTKKVFYILEHNMHPDDHAFVLTNFIGYLDAMTFSAAIGAENTVHFVFTD